MAVSISIAITQNSQSVANNTSNVTATVTARWTYGSWNATGQCTGSITIDGTKYSFSGIKFNTGQTTSGSQTIMTKTVNVSHNSNGTKTLSCSASFVTGVSSGTVTASASKTLTTIPRKSTLSVGNGTLGTSQTLTVTRQATSFTHTIKATCGSASTTICTKSTSTSISFTPPLSWASQNTKGTSVSVTYTITTYSGSTNVGSNSYTKTCSIPSSVAPTFTVEISDPTGYADKYGKWIQGQSKLKIDVTASGSYGSTIKSYSITTDDKTYTKASVTTGVISASKTRTHLPIYITVTDSRGRTASETKGVNVYPYSKPIINTMNVFRCDEEGNATPSGAYMAVAYNYAFVSLNNQNTATCSIQYKKQNETKYSDPVEVDGLSGVYIFSADTSSSYNIIMTVEDDFSTVPKATNGSSAKVLWSWFRRGLGVAFGKVAELEGVFDIAFPVKLREGIIQNVLWSGGYYMTSGHTVPLSEPVSKQPSGIVLVFSEYIDGAVSDTAFHTRFIPKTLVATHPGKGHCIQLSSSNLDYFATKYLYISDDKIVGHDNNGMTGTGDCGITFTNTRFVLRYVIGV